MTRKGFWCPRKRTLRNNSTARRMWRWMQRNGGWWQWNWPNANNFDAVERSTQ